MINDKISISKLFVYSLIVAVIVSILYYFVDRDVATYFYNLEDNSFKNFFKYITHFGKSEWFLVPSFLLYIYFRRIKKFIYARESIYIFMTNIVAGIVVWLFKVPFGRMRPSLYFQDNLYGFDFFKWFEFGSKYASFPSAHTMTVMSSVVALSLILPKWKYLLLALGLLVAMSRIVITEHYVSDVFFASFLGYIIAKLLHQYYFEKQK